MDRLQQYKDISSSANITDAQAVALSSINGVSVLLSEWFENFWLCNAKKVFSIFADLIHIALSLG